MTYWFSMLKKRPYGLPFRTTEYTGFAPEYFVRFTGLSGMQADVVESDILVFDSFAVNWGLYTFSYEGSGERVSVPARFSFTYIRREEGWRIIEHHSSVVPSRWGKVDFRIPVHD